MNEKLIEVLGNVQQRPPRPCLDVFPSKTGKCNTNECQSTCEKKKKQGAGICSDAGQGRMDCLCYYHCP
ncbi:unnamed protein product [Thlaspi arvense]|uniref:Uncharacterized protein n=1 Tax=Thlaspi arvense TaxID=13288 RepID=A0AAU9SS73_THLAR|nr:unnamed protein product [Thlaspi arvense]